MFAVKVLIAFFSYTGNTRAVAYQLATLLNSKRVEVDVEEIQPTKRYPYLYWLTLSFIPNLRTHIKQPKLDPSRYDLLCLGLPKWTLACPPINQYLKEVNLEGKALGLFVTYGGFDERRYLKQMMKQLAKKGAKIKATLLLKRSLVKEDKVEAPLRRFCDALLGDL
jgi:flavodoxin